MDPNEALRRIRELVTPGAERTDPDGAELSELVQGLDEWLSRGGFLPQAWAKGRMHLGTPEPAFREQWLDQRFGERIVVEPLGGPHPGVDGHPPEHGLDWRDLGHAYQGMCDCGEWGNGAETLDSLLALYELHIRAAGVPDYRKAGRMPDQEAAEQIVEHGWPGESHGHGGP
jgi:hypothetical protein